MPTGIGGEIAWWCPSLDDSGNGTATLNDLSGNGKTGTIAASPPISSAWVTDTDSGGIRAVVYDGIDDLVSASPALNALDRLSISTWVKSSTAQAAYFSYGVPSTFTNDILLFVSGGLLFCQVNNGADGGASVAYTPSAAVWRHIVAVFNGTETGNANRLKIYVDGTQQTLSFTGYTVPASTASPTSPESRLGTYYSAPVGFYMAGRQDDTRLFQRALSGGEVSALASQRGYQPKTPSDFESGMFGGMSGEMTGGMAS